MLPLVLALVLTQAPAPVVFKYVEWNYQDAGKAKTKQMAIELHADELRLVPKYPDKGQPIEAQSIRIPYTALKDVTASTTDAGVNFAPFVGFNSNGNWRWMTLKTDDADYVLKLLSGVKAPVLQSELERRRKK